MLPPVTHSAASAGEAHQQHAVVRRQPLGKVGEPVRHPRVVGHVGQHARAVDEAGLRRHEQQRALGDDRHQHERAAQPGRQPQLGDECLR